MCRLLQPTPHLPSDHPLVALGGSEAARWTQREMQTFQQALTKYDKDFSRISKEVGLVIGRRVDTCDDLDQQAYRPRYSQLRSDTFFSAKWISLENYRKLQMTFL